MFLKCRFLSQFSVADVSKNAASISKAANQCPFMSHAKRSLATEKRPEQQMQQRKSYHHLQQRKPEIGASDKAQCTDEINCPFFAKSGIDVTSPIFAKKKLSNSNQEQEQDHDQLSSTIIDNQSSQILQQIHQQKKQQQLQKKPLFDYDNFFSNKIEAKKRDGSYRQFKRVIRHAETFPVVEEHKLKQQQQKQKQHTEAEAEVKEMTIWCSNDYLGLGRHPYVQQQVHEAVAKFGVGSGGTRNISGSTPLHDKLESELAKLHEQQAALLFTSCYVANDTTLYTMAKMLPGCHILSDAGNHASMIQGIRNSATPKHIFRHNDTEHLAELLSSLPRDAPKIVAFETVHSMDGSICDLEKMCDVAHQYGGITFIDEVHAVGLYGQNGAGIGERDNLLPKMDIISGTLGKAFGNIGGYIAGSESMVDSMRSYGAGFIFTTSLPPSVAAGSLAALEISRSDEGRELRARHQSHAKTVKARLTQAGLPVFDSPSHIVPVMVGNVEQANEICNRLLNEHGIYIQAINYPTVARGTERLRIVPNPHHTPEMIDHLVESLVSVWKSVGLDLDTNNKKKRQLEQTLHF